MLQNELSPKLWSQYKDQDFKRAILTQAISKNKHPPAITLSGMSGTGKTSAAQLYIRSTLCLNRKDGNYEPCNNCSVCKSDPRTVGPAGNVIWVQKGGIDTINFRISEAIQEAYQPPNGFNEDHRWYKFIVIDELQSVPKDQIQRLLFLPEVKGSLDQNRVIFIFITMNEDAIDPKIMRPLADRTLYFKYRPISEEKIQEFLLGHFPNHNKESLKILASMANGSFRSALSNLDKCLQYDESLDPRVVSELMYYANDESRRKLWDAIQSGSFVSTRDQWRLLVERVDPDHLIKEMSKDLEKEMVRVKPTDEIFLTQRDIFSYQTSTAKIDPFGLIKVLLGRQLLDTSYIGAEC